MSHSANTDKFAVRTLGIIHGIIHKNERLIICIQILSNQRGQQQAENGLQMRLYNNFTGFFIAPKLALLQAIILVRISCQKVVKSEFSILIRQVRFTQTKTGFSLRFFQTKNHLSL